MNRNQRNISKPKLPAPSHHLRHAVIPPRKSATPPPPRPIAGSTRRNITGKHPDKMQAPKEN